MFHIKSNFNARGPVSQVPASWFNKVANFLNNFVAGYGLTLNKSADGPSVISLDPKIVPQAVTHQIGTPEDKTDKNADDSTDGKTWVWNVGGKNGIKMDAYCEVKNEEGWHYLSRCRLTISKDGLITKIEGLPGRREIQA
jgi:hypothetical protein